MPITGEATEARGLADLAKATEELNGGAWIWTLADGLQRHGFLASPLLSQCWVLECSSRETSCGVSVLGLFRSGRRVSVPSLSNVRGNQS